MTLSREQVDHVADLARLALSDEERELFRVQLSAILDYFDRLQEIADSGVEGTAGSHSLIAELPMPTEPGPPGSLRADQARPSLPTEDVLANAPSVEDERIRVPIILEERG